MGEWWASVGDGPLGSATWIDAVDVGILSLLVYGVLRALRGTRAFQVLLGLGALMGVYVLSARLGLATLHWVLDNLVVYAALALLILFQDDIRQVLARVGGTFFGVGSTAALAEADLLEEIVRAMFQLATRRIGALLVLERSASLDAFCERGHLVDAAISAELLQAIFHPSCPIHDGAVVVARGRVAEAAVFLPISLSRELPKSYGTRHRAAIGITERTDALCLLVSEERGTVAMVLRGQVIPVVDSNDLRQKLQETFGVSGEVSPA